MYRDVLRMIYKSHQKEGLLEYARGEFRVKGVGATEGRDGDLGHRKYLLNVGIQRVGEMAATISSTVSVSKQLGRIQQVKELL